VARGPSKGQIGDWGLRLTGGTGKGAKLFSVPGLDVRPALARMRISVFEILKPRLDGARVLDLFAGTGSLGLEALSRGAAHGVFLDVDERCIETLEKNVAKLKFGSRAELMPGSAFDAARLVGDRRFSLVFVDPPYRMYDERGMDLEKAVRDLALDRGALVLVEHRSTQVLADSWGGGKRVDQRVYGGTTVSFYEIA